MIITVNYSSKKIIEKIKLFLLRKTASNHFDPIIKSKIGKYYLKHRFSHNLPIFLNSFQNYNINMARITREVFKKYKDLLIIDIGANIGDSTALIKSYIDVPILCIEGDDDYIDLLDENTKNLKNVKVKKTILSDKKGKIGMKILGTGGTSRLCNSNQLIATETIDNLLKKHDNFEKAKFVKIDTDGFDGKIIRGGKRYLHKTKPVLFFEYDPHFLNKNNDLGLNVLNDLLKYGYSKALYYDNTGNYICSTSLSNKALLKELDHSVQNKDGIKYFDICVFSKEDDDLFNTIRSNELSDWT